MNPDLHFAISTGCFYQKPIEDVLHYFAENGFENLEICTFPAHLDFHDDAKIRSAARAISSAGLTAESLHAPFADGIDISSGDESKRKKSVSELRRACECAKLLDTTYIVLHPGPEKDRNLRPHEWYPKMQLAAESLNEIADFCTDIGLTLLLENMLPHLMFGHIGDMMYLLGAISSTNVGTCLDTGHAYLSGDLARVANKLSGHLRMIHANDNCGKWDDHFPPGDGDIEWEPLVRQLATYGFHGTIVLELSGQGSPEEILAGAGRGKAFLEDLFRGKSEARFDRFDR